DVGCDMARDPHDADFEDQIPTGPAPDDPRLKIPEVLRKPVQPPPDPDRGTKVSEGVQMGRAWATALNFVATIIGGALLGWFYDKWRGTSPVGAGIGLGFGFVVAFF